MHLIGICDPAGDEIAHLGCELGTEFFGHHSRVTISQRWLTLTKSSQDGDECIQHSLGGWSTSRIFKAITEKLGVLAEVGDNQHSNHLGSTDGLQPDDRTVMCAEWLGGVQETLET